MSFSIPPATPDLIVRPRSTATFAVVPGAGDDADCFVVNGMDEHCIHGIRHEFEVGLATVLGAFLTPAGTARPTYVASFGPISIHERWGGRYGGPSLVADWEFSLSDAEGHPIVHLHDTTVGAHPILAGPTAVLGPLEGLEDDVLERVRSAIGDSLVAHPAAPPP